MSSISIIDCATKTLTNSCYNRLVEYFKIPMLFHCPSMFGMDSLNEDNSKAYIIFGSYSNVEDRLDWQRDLANFIDKKLRSDIPVLGICFGHQLMADYYGAKIIENQFPYQGTRTVKFKDFESTFFVAHNFQVKNLPSELSKTGYSDQCENEVIQHVNLPFVGIQGHPEASLNFIKTTLNEIKIGEQEQSLALRDGLAFIENFFLRFDLL